MVELVLPGVVMPHNNSPKNFVIPVLCEGLALIIPARPDLDITHAVVVRVPLTCTQAFVNVLGNVVCGSEILHLSILSQTP